jgi:hypothetical protein
MRIISVKSVAAIALLLVLLATSLPACGVPPLPEIEARLSFSEPPILGKPVQLTATFDPAEIYTDVAHDVTASIILPEGFEKVAGDLEWQGDFIRDNTYTLSATVKSIKAGDWKIEAKALYYPREGECLGGSTVIYVSVSETGATVRSRPSGGGCRGPIGPTPTRTSPPAGYPEPSPPP